MHELQYPTCQNRVGGSKGLTEPIIKLFSNGNCVKLITFQSLTGSSGCIGMSGCRMPHTEKLPCSFWQTRRKHSVFHRSCQVYQILLLNTICLRNFTIRSTCRNTPHQSRFSFPLTYLRFTTRYQGFYLQIRFPLSRIHIFTSRLTAFGRPIETKIACRSSRDYMRRVLIRILPSLTSRNKLFHKPEIYAIITCHHFQTMRLIIVSGKNNFYIPTGKWFFICVLYPEAAIFGSQ